MENILSLWKGCDISALTEVEKPIWNQIIKDFEDKINFVSDLFKKTTTLTINALEGITPTEATIKKLFNLVIEREKNNGKPEMYLDADVWNWFPSFQEGHEAFESNSFTFIKNITNSNILKEGERLGLKRSHTYTEALSIIIQAILDGELDKIDGWKIVYFEAKNKEDKTVLYRFYTCRRDDGQLGVRVLEAVS